MKKVGRPKGYPKTGGRKKGIPNKLDKAMKELLQNFCYANLLTFQELFDDLDSSKEKLDVLEKFIQYVLPKAKQESEINIGASDGLVELKFASKLPKDKE